MVADKINEIFEKAFDEVINISEKENIPIDNFITDVVYATSRIQALILLTLINHYNIDDIEKVKESYIKDLLNESFNMVFGALISQQRTIN